MINLHRRFLLLFLPLLLSAPAAGAERVALVIGNAAYRHGNPLANPAEDARDIASSLKRCGFMVLGGKAQEDLSHEAMSKRIDEFRGALAEAEVALFYFSGHGMEMNGTNYLVPVDAEIEEEYQVKHRTVALDEILGAMSGDDRLKIVILDCCRDNPLGRAWRKSLSSGLAAPQSTPGGTILFFAAAPGSTASDGRGSNSPFTRALKTEL